MNRALSAFLYGYLQKSAEGVVLPPNIAEDEQKKPKTAVTPIPAAGVSPVPSTQQPKDSVTSSVHDLTDKVKKAQPKAAGAM